jgi:hypothetical protein
MNGIRWEEENDPKRHLILEVRGNDDDLCQVCDGAMGDKKKIGMSPRRALRDHAAFLNSGCPVPNL